MIANKLYRYFQFIYSKSASSSPLFKCQFKQNCDQQCYAMIVLPEETELLIDERQEHQFRLSTHHISFYEYEDNTNPQLSQYHYTAYFLNDRNKKYRLHVYFDQNDRPTITPILEEYIDSDKTVKQQNSKLFEAILFEFAIKQCAHIMRELRHAFNQEFLTLEHNFNVAEQALTELSIDFPNQRDKYLEKLTQTISYCDILTNFHPKATQYVAVNKLLKRFHTVVTTLKQSETRNIEIIIDDSDERELLPPSTDLKMTKELQKINDVINSFSCAIKQLQQSISAAYIDDMSAVRQSMEQFHQQLSLEGLSKEHFDQVSIKLFTLLVNIARELNKYFIELTTMHMRKRLLVFNIFYSYVQEVVSLIDQRQIVIALRDGQRIQTIFNAAMEQGKKLLCNLLIKNHFDLADGLIGFIHLFPENLFRMSLLQGNTKLLEYLLLKQDFSINTFNVKDNLTPVLFCYYHYHTNAQLIECLSILIKHNASIMIPAKEGLPLAYHIFQLPIDDPLKKVLFNNASKTLFRKDLVNLLIQQLRQYLQQKQINGQIITESMRMNIDKCIDDCSTLLLELSTIIMPVNDKEVARHYEMIDTQNRKISTATKDALLSDRELVNKMTQIRMLNTQFTQKLNSQQKRSVMTQGKDNIKVMEDQIDKLDIDDFLSAKEKLNQIFDAILKNIQLKIELTDVESELNAPNMGKKKLKHAKTRYKQILDKFNDNSKQLADLCYMSPTKVWANESMQIIKEQGLVLSNFKDSKNKISQMDVSEKEKQQLSSKAMIEMMTRLSPLLDKNIQNMERHNPMLLKTTAKMKPHF